MKTIATRKITALRHFFALVKIRGAALVGTLEADLECGHTVESSHSLSNSPEVGDELECPKCTMFKSIDWKDIEQDPPELPEGFYDPDLKKCFK